MAVGPWSTWRPARATFIFTDEPGEPVSCSSSAIEGFEAWVGFSNEHPAHNSSEAETDGSTGLRLEMPFRLVRLLLKGPMAQGYRTNLWTTPRIAEMVEREFGVRYHPDHIGRLMHSQGWTPQKPERRALERNEEEIERWKQEEWPRIKKRCKAGCPYRLCRRIGLPADSQCGQDLGSARTDSHPSSPPGTARQNLRHFWKMNIKLDPA